MDVELIYFDVQGRATQTRIMLKIAGIEFKDTRLTKSEFAERKTSLEECALGQIPILKVNGKGMASRKFPKRLVRLPNFEIGYCGGGAENESIKVYCQSDAIMEWAATKAGLIPENDEDALAMRMVVGEKNIQNNNL